MGVASRLLAADQIHNDADPSEDNNAHRGDDSLLQRSERVCTGFDAITLLSENVGS